MVGLPGEMTLLQMQLPGSIGSGEVADTRLSTIWSGPGVGAEGGQGEPHPGTLPPTGAASMLLTFPAPPPCKDLVS